MKVTISIGGQSYDLEAVESPAEPGRIAGEYGRLVWVDDVDGENRNPGTERAPVRSLQMAMRMAEPGDLIVIKVK